MKSKKLLSAVLTASMLLMLGGCGKAAQEPAAEAATEEAAVEETADKETEEAEPAEEAADEASAETADAAEELVPGVDPKYLNGEGLTFGFITTTLDNPVYVAQKDEVERICKATGMEMVVQTAGDAAAKVTAIESCVEAGCDIICYMADAATEGDDAVAAANEKGVTMGSCGAKVNGTVRGFGPDNYNLGYLKGTLCGQWIQETFGEEEEVQVGLLTYTPAEFVLEQDKGMRAGLADAAPNAVIVAEDNVYTPPTGMEATENFLQAYPDIKVVMGFCDSCALGAYQAFQMNGLDDDQHAVFGSDGIDEALAAIAEGGCFRMSLAGAGGTYQGNKMATQLLMIHNGYEFDDDGMEYWPMEPITYENVGDYYKN